MKSGAGLSLMWKIVISTSIAITLVFGVTGWLVQQHAVDTISAMLQDEVAASFRAYESLWKSRARSLASLSLVLSSMSDVRAAFSTGDRATIRDTAGELWSRISDGDAMFLVTDPQGTVIASLGGDTNLTSGSLGLVASVRPRFPEQVSGFMLLDNQLYQLTVTPVYVESSSGPTLLNVLVAGYVIDSKLANRLKESTGGSDFVFTALKGGQVLASSIPGESREVPEMHHAMTNVLRDLTGNPVAQLEIVRSLSSASEGVAKLRRNVFLIYLLALTMGLLLTTLLARRLLKPISELDRAASEVARQNYRHRLPVRSRDELGRLAATFNQMCESIEQARSELIRQERIATIGQLSTSIVHDLRNPLAAIYGGAEMLVDGKLPPNMVQRLAGNIYRASRNIQELLQELVDVTRGKSDRTELCRLGDVVCAAYEPLRSLAESARVNVQISIPDDLEVPLARARMERVFANLITNSVQAFKSGGGEIRISAKAHESYAQVDILDTGPGVSAEVRARLFEPFVSDGKKNGLGLGLALSRQTVLSHGGDLWLVENSHEGAHFRMRLPLDSQQNVHNSPTTSSAVRL